MADRERRHQREIELKLLAAPKVLTALRRSPLIARLAVGRAVTRRLLSVYYDTPDLALRERGLALRVRKTGAAYVQTLKTESGPGAASDRAEFEAPLADDRPDSSLIADAALRRFVTGCAGKSGLRPVYETDIRRTARPLLTPEGDRIELALDTGVIRANGHEEPVSELELELGSGSPAALFRLAGTIAGDFDVRLGALSKAARGYALATGESGIVPVRAATPALDPSMTVEDACCAVLRACLAQIVGNEPAVAAARDPEGVHQLRVGLRRLRSAAACFSGAGLEEWLEPLSAQARRFASRLGRARDLDVFTDEMLAPVMLCAPGHKGLALLHQIAEERRGAAWEKAVAAIASRPFTVFVLAASGLVEERPWRLAEIADALAGPAGDFAGHVLDKRLARVEEAGRAFARLTTEERHALRIELKKLRYTADSFAALYPQEAVGPFLKSLSRLQDVFGYLNDAAVAGRLARKLAKRSAEGKRGVLREAVGLMTGWHGRRAAQEWRQACKRWRAFIDIPPFWRR